MTGSRVVATITATALSLFHDLDVIVMTPDLEARHRGHFGRARRPFHAALILLGLRRPRLKTASDGAHDALRCFPR
jgi:hypothetical protein